ncbi:MAG: hypothetical protein GQ582_00740 [Methyloprofundus sp.]|nr:hypothetical protein [Methyloprofundus sp.]
MISVIRRLIILLLFILQGFAPLLHAHAHTIGSEEGIHIHGVTTVIAHTHEHELSELDNVACAQTTFSLHSAIQKKETGESMPAFISTADSFQLAAIINQKIGFSPPPTDLKSLLFTLNSAPRAPPVFTHI